MSTDKTIEADYKALAKKFGCTFRIWKYGIKLLPRDPNGKVYRLLNITPLDGWITDPAEIERIMREKGLEL